MIGGNLRNAIATSSGYQLSGYQEFTVEAKMGPSTAVVTGVSQTAGQFATAQLAVVMNAAGEYLIRIRPTVAYDRVRITNRLGGLIGLFNVKKLYVFEAYYLTNSPYCGDAAYTSYSGSNVTAANITAGTAGILTLKNAIDPASTTDYSTIKLGTLGTGPVLEQIVYFESLSLTADSFGIRLSMAQALIDLNAANNITIIASNGATVVQTRTLTQLLTQNAMTLSGGIMANVIMTPGAPIDRITVRFTSFSTSTVQKLLNLFGVSRIFEVPSITQNLPICPGSTGSLIATSGVAGAQIKWYDSAAKTNLLGTTTSGQVFVSPVITVNTTLYVTQTTGECTSVVLPVAITTITKPIAGTIAGEQTVCLTNVPALLTSVSADAGAGITYRWESSLDEIIWDPIVSNTTTYQPNVLLKSTFFRRITINTVSGIACESLPTNHIKVTTKNCMVYANPMVRQRIKNGI